VNLKKTDIELSFASFNVTSAYQESRPKIKNKTKVESFIRHKLSIQYT